MLIRDPPYVTVQDHPLTSNAQRTVTKPVVPCGQVIAL